MIPQFLIFRRRSVQSLLVAGALCLLFLAQPARAIDTDSIHLQLLDQKIVQEGGRRIVFNRVARPDLPERPVKEKPPLREFTAEEKARMEARVTKTQVSLLVEATVFDREISELRWSFEGKKYRCWSNLDLNVFGAFPTVETEDAVYSLFILATNVERESRKWIPAQTDFATDRADYLVIDAEGGEWNEEAFAGIEALHNFYEENKTELKSEYVIRKLVHEKQERERRENPPEPQDIVIHFWPKETFNLTETSNPTSQP